MLLAAVSWVAYAAFQDRADAERYIDGYVSARQRWEDYQREKDAAASRLADENRYEGDQECPS
jgi:hypothetical protein